MDLVCVGDNVADYYPEKNMFYPGGSAYNVAILTGRYGLKPAYIGTFGSDIAGKHQLKVLEKEGIDSSHITIKSGMNAISRIINRDGQSKVVKVNKGVYKQFALQEEDLSFISKFNYLHTTIYSYTEKYLSQFKESGLVISFDYSFKSTDKYLQDTAPYVNIAFFSGEDINMNLKKFMRFISKLGPEYVIVTLGNEGVMAFYDGNYYFQPAPQIQVVDTLGAGDSFIAMFLNCFIKKNFSLPRALKISTQRAAECCQKYGSIGWGRKIENKAASFWKI